MQTTPAMIPTECLEENLLARFKSSNPELFRKSNACLLKHLTAVFSILIMSTLTAILGNSLFLKIPAVFVSAFCWFCLINVTIHHHLTHHNPTSHQGLKKFLDFVYLISMPNAPKRKSRYTRAHLNHHLRPFHETDVDHHYGTRRYLRMMKKPLTALIYFFELTVIGGHVPGWDDDRYMNQVPLENWNQKDYEMIKKSEKKLALKTALWQWGLLAVVLFAAAEIGGLVAGILGALVWGWALPMLLVKNWAHFLGQFQHYKESFLDDNCSNWKRTKSFKGIPSWVNYLAAGELTGHFLHHLYPEMPYYHVEEARRRFILNPDYSNAFLVY